MTHNPSDPVLRVLRRRELANFRPSSPSSLSSIVKELAAQERTGITENLAIQEYAVADLILWVEDMLDDPTQSYRVPKIWQSKIRQKVRACRRAFLLDVPAPPSPKKTAARQRVEDA